MDISYKCPCCEEQGEYWVNLQQGMDHIYAEFTCENCDKQLTIEIETNIEIVGLFETETD